MKLKNTILALSLLAASASAGAAEFYTYTNPTSPPGTGNLTNNNPSGTDFASVAVTGYSGRAGQFSGNFWTGPSNVIPPDSFFRFFCAELTQTTSAGPVTYQGSEFTDAEIAKLYDVAYPRNGADDFWNVAQTNFGVFANSGGFTAAEYAAAFQVALWNILLDTDLDLTGGLFQWTTGGSANVRALAIAMLNAVDNYSMSDTGYTNWILFKFVSPVPGCTAGAAACGANNQDYVSAIYRFPTPEPGTLALFGLALFGLGAASRKQRRN